jgi:hypothetical protein
MEKNQPTVVEEKSLDAWFDSVETSIDNLEEVKEELPLDSLFDKEEIPQQPLPEIKQVKEDDSFTKHVKFLIDKGYWEDVDIEIEDPETGEKKAISISDVQMTPELFEQIEESQKELKATELKSKYVSVEGLDDATKKMIELKKAGGDLSELIQIESEYVHPLKNLNLEDEEHQEYLVRQKLMSQGLDNDVIDYKIHKLKKELVLDTEAKKVAGEVEANFNNIVEQKKQEQLEQIEIAKEEHKQFTKSVKEAYKNLNVSNEGLLKGLIEKASKIDEYGLSEADKLYFESKKNPELFAKVNFLLNDEKAFNELLGVKIKNEVSKNTFKQLITLKPKTASQKTEQSKKGSDNDLDELFQ